MLLFLSANYAKDKNLNVLTFLKVILYYHTQLHNTQYHTQLHNTQYHTQLHNIQYHTQLHNTQLHNTQYHTQLHNTQLHNTQYHTQLHNTQLHNTQYHTQLYNTQLHNHPVLSYTNAQYNLQSADIASSQMFPRHPLWVCRWCEADKHVNGTLEVAIIH
jgi:hypothetical protein